MNYKIVVVGAMVLTTATLAQSTKSLASEIGVASILNSTSSVSVTSEVLIEETVDVVEDVSIAKNVGVGSVLNEVAVIADKEVEQQIADDQTWGYTNLGIAVVDNHLNIRDAASESGSIVGKLANNAACEIISFDGEWVQIVSGEVEGYVSTQYLLMGEYAIERANEVVATIATVTTDALKVREEPNTECAIVTTVANGEQLEVVDASLEGWVKIRLDNEEVYVSAEFVSVNDQLQTAYTMTELLYGVGVSDVRVDLVNYAKQFLGNPYVYGGTSLTNGADCSGFVQSVFKNFGVSLPRTSASQSSVGTTISASELMAGDLIFYAQGGSVNHVAIYIGNGQVVHASNPSTGIRISNLYYREPYTMKRILP
ncbi:MAG: NlpC/P60 family protein [Eubacteriales bacterium]